MMHGAYNVKYEILVSPATDIIIQRLLHALLLAAVCDDRHIHVAINAIKNTQTEPVTQ